VQRRLPRLGFMFRFEGTVRHCLLWRARSHRQDDLRGTTAETYRARALFPPLLLDHAERVASIRTKADTSPPPAQVLDSIFKQPRPSLRNQRRECVPDDKAPREQSIKPQRKMDCFVASLLAMTASPHTASRSRRNAPKLCIYSSPKMEGAGNAGCPLHPQPPVRR
jgi:hypothetical protein